MYRFVSHPHSECPDQLDSHAAWQVVDSPEVARAFFVRQTQQSKIPTLYFYDNDIFFNGLTALHIPTDGPPQQVEGPNAVIFGDDPVQVIVDLSRIPQPLSALNGLFDDPNPHYQGRRL